MRIPVAPHPYQHLVYFVLHFHYSDRYVVLRFGFKCISMMINKVGYIFYLAVLIPLG